LSTHSAGPSVSLAEALIDGYGIGSVPEHAEAVRAIALPDVGRDSTIQDRTGSARVLTGHS